MKIIYAIWEKRNLGVDVVEFVIERDDNEIIVPEILKTEKQYNVVKLPVGKPKLTMHLQDNGYRFVECMLNLKHDLNKSKVESAKLLSNADVTYLSMNEHDRAELFTEIEKGLFNTDRIYNDSNFTTKMAATRYKNWINDEWEKGSITYKLIFNGKSIGFFSLKKMENNIFDPFLLGLYNDYKGQGFGKSMAFNALSECLNQGAKEISTHISSNNPINVRVYKSLGYDICDIEYVFIKHN